MGKKKSKNQEVQGAWEWICKTWYAYKAKPFWAILMTVGIFLCTGILNSFLGNFFDSCSKVMNNASIGFWKKSVDLYYVMSAKTELTDASLEVFVIICTMLIGLVWILRGIFMSSIDDLKRTLEDIIKTGSEIDSANKDTDGSVNWEVKQKELITRNKQLRNTCETNIVKCRKEYRRMTVVVACITMVLLLNISLTVFAYNKVKDFRQSVSAIRPFITDSEFYALNRQWVLMTSKADYEKIIETLTEYAKRGTKQSDGNNSEIERGKVDEVRQHQAMHATRVAEG